MERTEIGPYGSRWSRKANRPPRGAAFWAYLLGLPIVIFAVVTAALAVRTLDESLGKVAHTREVREHLNAGLGTLLDGESAQRGFLLTRDMFFAQQFTDARIRFPAELEQLRVLTADNPAQQATLRELGPLFEQRFALMERVIALDGTGAHAEALRLVQSGAGRTLTDQIRGQLNRMHLEELRLLESRTALGRKAVRSVLVSVFGTGLLALALIGLLRYLTARQEKQRSVRESHLAEQARLLDLSRDAIIARDASDRVRYWSQGAVDLYGYTREEALGRVTHELLRTGSAESLDQMRSRLERTGRWKGELRHSTKAGDRITTLSTWTLDRDETGAVQTILEANNDITDIKATQADLQRSNLELAQLTTQLEARVAERTRELSEANTELEAFARSVAHDLRAPLRTMQGFTAALIEDYSSRLPAEGQSFVQRIATSAERMDRLILDLLEYARLSRTEIQIEPVPLDQTLASVADDLQRSGGEISIHVDSVAVRANRTLLAQVITNLLSNAFKFVPAGTVPRVEISAEAHNGRVRVWVSDNGIGIAPQDQQRIFGVFERLHGHESYPGTGIGLAIVRRAIERMGGTVGVISEVGRGSRFWFELDEARGPS